MIYFVATPIGNLKDITLRALEVLRGADVIFCEDTRHSLKLLNAYDIKKPVFSCHKFNENSAAEKIAAAAREGKEVCVISDAGMPVISDPGNLVCRKLSKEGLRYTVIPGANAALSALVLSGFPAERFCFLGFPPEKEGERQKLFSGFSALDATLILHCAPQDIDGVVKSLYKVLGERRACAVREITKIHEESVIFNLSQGLEGEKRGEYVLLVEGAGEARNPLCDLTVQQHVQSYMDRGYDKKEAIKLAARDRGVAKSEIYKQTLDL